PESLALEDRGVVRIVDRWAHCSRSCCKSGLGWTTRLQGGRTRRMLRRAEERLFPGSTIRGMSEPLQLTVVYEEGEDGYVLARVREVPGAMSQGRTHDEARENVALDTQGVRTGRDRAQIDEAGAVTQAQEGRCV